MKTLAALWFMVSLSAFADYGAGHAELCASSEAKRLMGTNGLCQIVLSPVRLTEFSARCEGKLADISCRVMLLKTSESASMTLVCGEDTTPLLSQVLEAETISYTVSAVVKMAAGDYVTINDPRDYHLFSNPALEVQLGKTQSSTEGKMRLTIQQKSIVLTDVTCR